MVLTATYCGHKFVYLFFSILITVTILQAKMFHYHRDDGNLHIFWTEILTTQVLFRFAAVKTKEIPTQVVVS